MTDSKKLEKITKQKLDKRFDKKLCITVFYQCIAGTENNYIQETQAETIYIVNPFVFDPEV